MGIQTSYENFHKLIFTRQYGYHEIYRQFSTPNLTQAIKYYELTSLQQQKSFQNLISMYQCFNVPTILPILHSEILNNENDLKYGWRLIFKYLQKNLDQEIQQRIKAQKRYTQDEILKTLDCVLSALMAFQLKRLFHGNVNCENILIDDNPYLSKNEKQKQFDRINEEDQKVYVIGLPLLLNNEDISTNLSQKTYHKLYLSPQTLTEISEGKMKISTTQKNDVFSLGLVVLRMSSFCNISQLYDYQKMKIKAHAIQKCFHQCGKMYTEGFCEMMKKMLEINQKERLDFEGILNYFSALQTYMNENSLPQEFSRKLGESSFRFNFSSAKKNKSIQASKHSTNKKLTLAKNIQQKEMSKSRSKSKNQASSSKKKSPGKGISRIHTPQNKLFTQNKNFSQQTPIDQIQQSSYDKNIKRCTLNWVKSEALLEGMFISKQNERAWIKFKNRMINKHKGTQHEENALALNQSQIV